MNPTGNFAYAAVSWTGFVVGYYMAAAEFACWQHWYLLMCVRFLDLLPNALVSFWEGIGCDRYGWVYVSSYAVGILFRAKALVL